MIDFSLRQGKSWVWPFSNICDDLGSVKGSESFTNVKLWRSCIRLMKAFFNVQIDINKRGKEENKRWVNENVEVMVFGAMQIHVDQSPETTCPARMMLSKCTWLYAFRLSVMFAYKDNQLKTSVYNVYYTTNWLLSNHKHAPSPQVWWI